MVATTPRRLALLAAFAAGGLAATKLSSVLDPGPKPGYWRNQAGFTDYLSAYTEAMATTPQPTHTHDVRIDFGSVRVYEWAPDRGTPAEALPVVLVPGIRSGVPMWAENLPHWIGERRVLAMDAVGDAGMSTHAIPFESFDHQVDWLEEVLAEMGLDQVHVVGHSFGGAIAATHSLHHPQRVATLTLLEPVMVLHGMPPSIYLWSTMLMLPLPQGWKDRALAEIGGVSVEEVKERTPVAVMIDEGATHYNSVTLTPRTLRDAEWHSMPMPIHVEIASDRSLAGGERAAERARTLGLHTVTVRPNTTHSLPLQAAEELGRELLSFWARSDVSQAAAARSTSKARLRRS